MLILSMSKAGCKRATEDGRRWFSYDREQLLRLREEWVFFFGPAGGEKA
jgi:hypothetical protein